MSLDGWLNVILFTLSQNWSTGVELMAKTRKDSNSLLTSLIMWFLDLSINLFQKEIKLKETILAMLAVNFMRSQQSRRILATS